MRLKIFFFIATFFLTFILLSLVANFPYELNVNKTKDPELKTILLWNTFFGDKTFKLR